MKKLPFTHKEIKIAANEALKHGYKENEIRRYFRQKGYKSVEIRKILNSTDIKLFQTTYELIGIIGFINLIIGIAWFFLKPDILTKIGTSYLHIIYGAVLILFSILISKKIFWALMTSILLLGIDILNTISLLGNFDNIIGPLLAKILLFSWVIRGVLPAIRLKKQ